MSKLSILQEKAREEFDKAADVLSTFEKEWLVIGGLHVFLDTLVASTYLTAIKDAIAAVPFEEESCGGGEVGQAFRNGWDAFRKELLTRLEALKRV